ncbi:hypothetical protein [Rhodoferax fermentans]|uniref:Uncharacterized protein n=1 Tax=Rhodoferax fermentans TaxID=28066 RepID=A0A1T1AP03_RHOFE|nr:hypothetical protein [Rhodoferax fermentans]MBK1683463.1 hypothetical protein [Rhodoferax fermentans]OOV05794.1 hypothetical protein RF819_02885 [Rhodoferax fermentans]
MKVNPTSATHLFPMKPVKRYASTKAPGTALSVQIGIPKDEYDSKDLRPFDGRPGALDFLKCPSRGF